MPHRRSAITHGTTMPAILEALRPLVLARILRRGRHLIWQGTRNRERPCIFTRKRTWGAAKVLFLLNGGVLVNGQHLWKHCTISGCVGPRCYSTEPPAWSPKRRAAEEARKKHRGRTAPFCGIETSERWAAKEAE
jgi:hypothetical protein